MIPTNTSKYVLRLNVSNARSGLLYHWIGLLKTRISVACTAILNIRRIGRRFSLIWLRKPFIGELTERKICYQNVGESVREVRIGDPPSERCTGVSALDCNATFQVRPQGGTIC